MKGFLVCAALIMVVAATAPDASALPLGPRIGITADEELDQIHVGFHATMAEPFVGVHFVPNLEIGFGDDVTLYAFNGDLVYTFPEMATADWSRMVARS